MKQTFEKFLEEICFKINPAVLDDDIPDFFDKWLGELEGTDYLKWGELYGTSQFLAGKDEIIVRLDTKE